MLRNPLMLLNHVSCSAPAATRPVAIASSVVAPAASVVVMACWAMWAAIVTSCVVLSDSRCSSASVLVVDSASDGCLLYSLVALFLPAIEALPP